MAGAKSAIKSIRDTFLYTMINKHSDGSGDLDSVIKTMIDKGVKLDQEMLNTQYSTINNYYKFALKVPVMESVYNTDPKSKSANTIIPMMYPAGITSNNKIPTCLPFVLTAAGGVSRAIAIVDNYAKFDKDNKGRVIIDTTKLYTFLEGAFIARGIALGFNHARQHTAMYTQAASIWSHMFIKVLNRKFSLNTNKDAYDKILFLAAEYFLRNLLQLEDSPSVFNYALKATNDLKPAAAKQLNDAFTDDCYKNIGAFITAISERGYHIMNGLQQLTVRGYVQDFIRMYSNCNLFSLEHLAYFVFNIISVHHHAYLNNHEMLKDIVGNDGDRVYGHLASVAKDY